ncbi:hypothetical protein J6590_009856 [Homalodisca vitripennis]|nr:hypothetical protein J6590_009856 [Homalodisca vitripennis]
MCTGVVGVPRVRERNVTEPRVRNLPHVHEVLLVSPRVRERNVTEPRVRNLPHVHEVLLVFPRARERNVTEPRVRNLPLRSERDCQVTTIEACARGVVGVSTGEGEECNGTSSTESPHVHEVLLVSPRVRERNVTEPRVRNLPLRSERDCQVTTIEACARGVVGVSTGEGEECDGTSSTESPVKNMRLADCPSVVAIVVSTAPINYSGGVGDAWLPLVTSHPKWRRIRQRKTEVGPEHTYSAIHHPRPSCNPSCSN